MPKNLVEVPSYGNATLQTPEPVGTPGNPSGDSGSVYSAVVETTFQQLANRTQHLRARWAANYAAARALNANFDGGVIFVAGGSTQGDSASGFFYYDSTDNTSSDDSAMVLVDTVNRRWKRIVGNEVLDVWFPTLQAAVNWATSKGVTLRVTRSWTLTSTLNISEGARIDFVGGATLTVNTDIPVVNINATNLRLYGLRVDTSNVSTYTNAAVTINGRSNMYDRFDFRIGNWRINGYFDTTVGGGTGLLLKTSGGHISIIQAGDVSVRGYTNGVYLQANDGGTGGYLNGCIFSDLKIAACVNGIVLEQSGSSSEVSGNYFTNLQIQWNANFTQRFIKTSGKVLSNVFEGRLWDYEGSADNIAVELQGNGTATGAAFNHMEFPGFGYNADDNLPSPFRYPRNNILIVSPIPAPTHPVIPPTGLKSLGFTGTQDNSLAFADKRFTVTYAGSFPGGGSLTGGTVANLFDIDPNSQMSWTLNSGDSATITINLGSNKDYIRMVGINFNWDSVPSGVKVETSANGTTWTTRYNDTKNIAAFVKAQNPNIDGFWAGQYIRVTFSNPTPNPQTVEVAEIWGQVLDSPQAAYLPQGGGTVWGNLTNKTLAGTGNRAVYSDPNGLLTNSTSDIRLKNVLYKLSELNPEELFEKLEQLTPFVFTWKDRIGPAEYGFSAQEVNDLFPELVGINADGYLSLDYPKMVVIHTAILKEILKRLR